jgi:cadmium resistance protein CadD (predicted permease)
MTDFFSLIGIGVSAFVATNIDDIFVLMMFFSSSNFQKGHVVVAQYLGIGLLIVISTLGSFLALVVPQYIIGLMGLVPISIGIIRLIHMRKHDNLISEQTTERVSKWHHLSMVSVATVTFSNGGDNIGIYTPLFAKYNSAGEIVFISLIFMIMTGIWCIVAYYLMSHPLVATRFRKIGHIIFPFVLIGLGIFILISSFSPPTPQ